MSNVDSKIRRSLAKISEQERRLKNQIKNLNSPEYMRELGEWLAKKIKVRTRLGFGVQKVGAEKSPHKPLSPDYVKRREELQNDAESDALNATRKNGKLSRSSVSKKKINEAGGLHPHTTAKRSNLTASGQLLDSIKVTSSSARTVTVGPTGTRKGESVTNQEVASGLDKQGRKFMPISKDEISAVSNRIKADAKALFRKALK